MRVVRGATDPARPSGGDGVNELDARRHTRTRLDQDAAQIIDLMAARTADRHWREHNALLDAICALRRVGDLFPEYTDQAYDLARTFTRRAEGMERVG